MSSESALPFDLELLSLTPSFAENPRDNYHATPELHLPILGSIFNGKTICGSIFTRKKFELTHVEDRQRGSVVPDQPCAERAHQEAVETINGKRTPQHVKRTQNVRLIRTHAGPTDRPCFERGPLLGTEEQKKREAYSERVCRDALMNG
ncbi:hypothetical protein NPIL_56781 [Nephila pilipes]|uniref:Uncharacterized protein n=1 Tax=Nephila pilipes TaxID=299642 RepID=A0A8X6NZ76_NEPPI|nr:hypothetical protein NPIL_56781 [Nephila pilipes]